MFHIQKKIREAIKNPEYLKLMSDIVKTNKPKDIFNVIYNYKVELDYDKKIEELKKVEHTKYVQLFLFILNYSSSFQTAYIFLIVVGFATVGTKLL